MDTLIRDFIIKHGALNLDTLRELLSQLDCEEADRFLYAIYDLADIAFPSDCALTVVDRNGVTRTFKEYNYLKDRVYYTYEKEVTRYYPSKEKADGWGYDYHTEKSEGYEVMITKTITYTDYSSLAEWKRLSKKDN